MQYHKYHTIFAVLCKKLFVRFICDKTTMSPANLLIQPAEKSQTKTKGRFIFCSLKFLSEVFRISSEQTPPPSFTITNHKNESSNSLTQRSNAIANSTSFLLQKTADHPTSLPGEIFRCPRGKTTIWVAAQHSGRFPRRHAQHPERRCAPKGHFSGYQEFYGSNGHGDQK